jgi:hypothetical protein
MSMTEPSWVPDACTLPTREQPLRMAEFHQMFADALRVVIRPAPTLLRLVLLASAEATVRDLTARESACCSFFDFTITHSGGDAELTLDIGVPAAYEAMLDALAAAARSTHRG